MKHRWKPPEPIRRDGIVGIPLTQGAVAWLDESDYPIVAPYVWRTLKRGWNTYAIARVNGHTTTMQKLIMKPEKGLEIDHCDGVGTHNFRWNLRAVSHRENMLNSRRCRGQHCLRQVVELPDLP